MIIIQNQIETTEEELSSVTKQYRPSLSEQIDKDRRKQNQQAAIYKPDTQTVEETS